MRRLMIVYNPRSSKFLSVKTEVLDYARELPGFLVGKFEVQPTNIMDNARKLSQILENNDLVVAAGGDGTATICLNAAMLTKKDVELGVLPYGNFNDLAHTLRAQSVEDILEGKVIKYWPLEIIVDGKHFRYASSYVTIGMTAEAVELFDEPKVRKYLQGGHKSSWKSYLYLARWYFKNRHKKTFLPEFKLNGNLMHRKTSDYCAINGKTMARVMKGGDWYLNAKTFRHQTGRLCNLWNLTRLMVRSIFKQVPGTETRGDVIEFINPATVELQAEGEYKIFENVSKIEIKKSEQLIKCIARR